jgi:transposase-like protein
LESGRLPSLASARRAYGIGGEGTIRKWLSKYGRNDLRAKVIRVETPKQRDHVKKLKQQVRQLEQALAQTQVENLINESLYEVLCEDVGVDPDEFKKKVDAGPSKKLSRNRRRRNQ